MTPSPSSVDPRHPLARLLNAAEAHPHSLALHNDELSVTYEDFAGRILRLATVFRRDAPMGRVLLSLEKGLDAYAAPFAAMAVRAVYCPLNPDLPLRRRLSVGEAFEPDVILTDRPEDWEAHPQSSRVLRPDEVDEVAELPEDLELELAIDDRPAYVIFTSGSSGDPKGVVIPLTGLCHYLDWAVPALGAGPGSRCSQHPNLGFDLSVLDVFASLCSGATLIPLSSAVDRMFPGRAIERHAIDTWVSVPSVVDVIARAGDLKPERLRSLRLMVFCGEPLRRPHCRAIFDNTEHCRILNTYGPTEATVSCTVVEVTRENLDDISGESVAIGDPIGDMSLGLDEGDEGELVISGPQVALGYWRDTEATARVFDPANRSYRTGDWVRRKGRNLFVTGRIDRQVKVRGHRLELGEVETRAREVSGGRAVAAFVRDESIVLVVEGVVADATEFRSALSDVLPDYMLPADVVGIAAIPRTPNDKIDYRSLEAAYAR